MKYKEVNKNDRTKFNKKIIKIYALIFIVLFFIFNLNIFNLVKLPTDIYTNFEEIENANKDKLFSDIVSIDFDKNSVKTGKNGDFESIVIFKLFGFIPIKKVNIKILPEEEVYAGGNPIGLTVYTDGAMVISNSDIDLKNNEVSSNRYIKNGDIIKSIDGHEINDLTQISQILEDNKNESINIEVIRNGKIKNFDIPILKDNEGKSKLGIWVKNDVSGIGTLTFVVKNNNGFGALGHPVTNGKSDNCIDIKNGNIYKCTLVGIDKGKDNDPGQLKCVFVQKNEAGSIEKNTKFGIFGKLNSESNLIDPNVSYKLGGRLGVRPGKATIISSISGIREEYEIEIIKANYQKSSDDKSIIFRVKDKRLLDLTGGIVQGMSGSPIVQNGKIIGAVTHVFLNDSTKGYGVYTDFMLEELNSLK